MVPENSETLLVVSKSGKWMEDNPDQYKLAIPLVFKKLFLGKIENVDVNPEITE